jgi:tRNA dimethylallyltransferase
MSSMHEEYRLPIILLAGPTAVGKTSLSLEIASRLGTEIVNADSMQVYRFMDIGTAKPTAGERARVCHHLLDVVNPDESFDASHYIESARPVLAKLHARGLIPLVVGGTGLYMKVLTRGICEGPPGDAETKERLLLEERERGLAVLHGELARFDPSAAGRIHPHDRQRILRALEVYRLTGTPLSRWQEQHGFGQTVYRTVKIFLYKERDKIYDQIDRRVRAMMGQGFLEEVRHLLGMGYGADLKPMQSLGYKQLTAVLDGRLALDEAVVQIQRETRRYAKRQMTWFRGDPEFRWIRVGDRSAVTDQVLKAVHEQAFP